MVHKKYDLIVSTLVYDDYELESLYFGDKLWTMNLSPLISIKTKRSF